MTPHNPDRHAMLARAAEGHAQSIYWAIEHGRMAELLPLLNKWPSILREIQSGSPDDDLAALREWVNGSSKSLREIYQAATNDDAQRYLVQDVEKLLAILAELQSAEPDGRPCDQCDPSFTCYINGFPCRKKPAPAVASGSGEEANGVKILEIRRRLRDSQHHLVNWWDSDIETLLFALRASEERCRELEKERDNILQAYNVLDGATRQSGAEKTARIASLEAELKEVREKLAESEKYSAEMKRLNNLERHETAIAESRATALQERVTSLESLLLASRQMMGRVVNGNYAEDDVADLADEIDEALTPTPENGGRG